MEEKTLKLILLLLFCYPFSITNAQETITVSGGDALGTGGSVNYSVGQIVQNTNNGNDGSVVQGIQFYFESSTLIIIDLETNLNITTYPNPVSSMLNIKTTGNTTGRLTYKLFNLLGELINGGDIIDNSTQINIENLDIATYVLQVSNSSSNKIETFKIIKN